jgi:hypothetical protein
MLQFSARRASTAVFCRTNVRNDRVSSHGDEKRFGSRRCHLLVNEEFMAILVGRPSAHDLLMDFSVTHIHPRSLADPFRFHACADTCGTAVVYICAFCRAMSNPNIRREELSIRSGMVDVDSWEVVERVHRPSILSKKELNVHWMNSRVRE